MVARLFAIACYGNTPSLQVPAAPVVRVRILTRQPGMSDDEEEDDAARSWWAVVADCRRQHQSKRSHSYSYSTW